MFLQVFVSLHAGEGSPYQPHHRGHSVQRAPYRDTPFHTGTLSIQWGSIQWDSVQESTPYNGAPYRDPYHTVGLYTGTPSTIGLQTVGLPAGGSIQGSPLYSGDQYRHSNHTVRFHTGTPPLQNVLWVPTSSVSAMLRAVRLLWSHRRTILFR